MFIVRSTMSFTRYTRSFISTRLSVPDERMPVTRTASTKAATRSSGAPGASDAAPAVDGAAVAAAAGEGETGDGVLVTGCDTATDSVIGVRETGAVDDGATFVAGAFDEGSID